MKKLLVASSALVAATAFAGVAQAADPIKLSLSGFGFGAVTYYDQDDSAIAGNEVNNFVVTGDNEIHFKGSTTLDNGLTVAVKYEVRTGGQGMSNQGDSTADEWSITTSGSFGNIILGAEDAATEAVAIAAPHMGGRLLGAGLSEGSMIFGNFVQNPGVRVQNATFINSNDENQISYVSNEIAGFTVGATYVPGLGDGGFSTTGTQALIGGNNVFDLYGIGAMYSGEFSGVGVKASAGYATGDSVFDDFDQWQAGLGFSYAGFTLSGGYTQMSIDETAGANDDYDRTAWEVGVGYKTGPYGVALGYFRSDVGAAAGAVTNFAAAGANDDEASVWQLTSQYTMGPGVMLVGGIALADFDGGEAGAGNPENDGVVVQTGINLSF